MQGLFYAQLIDYLSMLTLLVIANLEIVLGVFQPTCALDHDRSLFPEMIPTVLV